MSVGKPFEKGKSGNPKGRPKENDEIKKYARKFSREAVDRLLFWMRSDNSKASPAASNAILDRGHGKPAQAITDADGGPLAIHLVKFADDHTPK